MDLQVSTQSVTPHHLSMRALMNELYPLPRSVAGPGLRDTLEVLRRELPELRLHEVPSGAKAFDWIVPYEWSVNDATLVAPDGTVVADFKRHNLMLVSHSEPFSGRLPLEALRQHLHTLPDRPQAIPYVTAFYQRKWGFCLPDATARHLDDGMYEVNVDSVLAPGSLNYGEMVIPGRSQDEVLLSSHVCHPSMVNDNLSGVVVLAALARWLSSEKRRLTYRVVFAPATIGTLAFLSRTPEALERTRYGLVLAGLGGEGPISYKSTIDGEAHIDRAARLVLSERGDGRILPFSPVGYDERQYASPGIRLPVGGLGRAEPGTYPEYHTSLDDLDFVRDDSLEEAVDVLKDLVTVLEENQRFVSLAPQGEPQLGRRGLYAPPSTPGAQAVLWTLVLADGGHDLVDVANRSGLPFAELIGAKHRLQSATLIELDQSEPSANGDL